MARNNRFASPFANLRNDFHGAFIEFIGTTFFFLFSFGAIQAAAASSTIDGDTFLGIHQVIYISLAMAVSLAVSSWIFFRVSGGLFNPNVTLALFLTGALGPLRFVLYCIAQMAGAIAAAAIVRSLTHATLASNVVLGTRVNKARAVFIEMFVTSALVLAVLMLSAERYHVSPFAPIGLGLTLFMGQLFSVYFTGGAMNTARAFGPAVISGFQRHHWIYWLGPFLGSLLGSAFYVLLRRYESWSLLPGGADGGVGPTGFNDPARNSGGGFLGGGNANNRGVVDNDKTHLAGTTANNGRGMGAQHEPVGANMGMGHGPAQV